MRGRALRPWPWLEVGRRRSGVEPKGGGWRFFEDSSAYPPRTRSAWRRTFSCRRRSET